MYEQKQILESIFDKNVEFSPELYQRYRELCEQRQEFVQNEDERRIPKSLGVNRPEFNLDKAATIAAASNFWIEIRYVVRNLGWGVPGNQIEFQRGSRVFFGFDVGIVPRNTIFGTRIIRYRNRDNECNMRLGNNHMDKLNLPAPGALGLDTYENKILLFTRRGEEKFDMRVFPLNRIDRFRRLSSNQNSLYKMKSGREYGVY